MDSITSIRETPVIQGETPVIHPTKRERYARTPDSALEDKRLGLSAKAVYAAIARHAFRGGKAYVGQRQIAELLGTSQMTISRAIQELTRFGHIRLENATHGRRASMNLTSNIFQPKDRKKFKGKRKGISSVTIAAGAGANAAAARDAILGA